MLTSQALRFKLRAAHDDRLLTLPSTLGTHGGRTTNGGWSARAELRSAQALCAGARTCGAAIYQRKAAAWGRDTPKDVAVYDAARVNLISHDGVTLKSSLNHPLPESFRSRSLRRSDRGAGLL